MAAPGKRSFKKEGLASSGDVPSVKKEERVDTEGDQVMKEDEEEKLGEDVVPVKTSSGKIATDDSAVISKSEEDIKQTKSEAQNTDMKATCEAQDNDTDKASLDKGETKQEPDQLKKEPSKTEK